MLEPAFALNPPSVSIMFWATVSSLKFLPEHWRNKGLAKISGEDISSVISDDPLAHMIAAAAASYSVTLPTPKTLSADELKKISFPVYVALADHSPITGDKAAKRAKLIPDVQVKIWENTTHSLPMETAELLAEALNAFWAANQSV